MLKLTSIDVHEEENQQINIQNTHGKDALKKLQDGSKTRVNNQKTKSRKLSVTKK